MKRAKLIPSVIMLIICFLTLCTGVCCASVISVAINGDLSIIPADLSNLASVTLRSSSLVDATMTINDVTSQEHTSITCAKMELAEDSIPDTSTIEVEISLKNVSLEPVGAFFAHKGTTIASGSYATDSDIVVYDTITESSTTQAKIYCTSYTPVASQETVTMKLKIKLIDTDMASIAKKISYNLYVEEYVPTENYTRASGLVKLPYNDITTITSSTFSYNVNTLTYVALPNTITQIEDGTFSSSAFGGASNLKGINISNIPSPGAFSFYDCTSLQSVTLSDSLTSLPTYIFRNCTSLEDIDIPKSIVTIDGNAFGLCTSISEIDLSNCTKLTTIGNSAFDACASKVILEGCTSLKTIESLAFSYSNIESITIVSSITTLGAEAFLACDMLNTVIIESATIAKKYNRLFDVNDDYLLEYPTYIYVKSGLSVGSYLSNTSNYSKTTITSGEYSGYVLYTKL